MGVFTGRFPRWDPLFTLLAALFCLAARAAHVFPLAFLANWGRRRKIPLKMQVVMWFAGLRGAIAFALAQNMPGALAFVWDVWVFLKRGGGERC